MKKRLGWWWLVFAWGFYMLGIGSILYYLELHSPFGLVTLPAIAVAGLDFMVGAMGVVTAYKECMGE